jgi:hypothetical protein
MESAIKLIRRSGDFRTYETDKGIIEVKLCLNPNIYTNPGYYLTLNNDLPREILCKRFSSGKAAVKAAYNSIA